MRKLAATLVTAAVAGGVIGVVGAAAPVAAQATDNTAFCDAAFEVEKIFSTEEFDRLDAALSAAEASVPAEIAPNLQTLAPILRDALENQSDPSQDPAFEENLAAIQAYEYGSCGWQTADVTLLEYEFDGLPKSFTTGPAIIKLTNTGAEVHEMAVVRRKTNDALKKVLALPEKKAEKKVAFVGHGFAGPGETGYVVLDLAKPGRYGAACFIPVGTTDVSELEGEEMEHGGGGKPHFTKGMLATFKVTAA